MPVREPLIVATEESSDLQQLQPSKYPSDQKNWLLEKYPLYQLHHNRKSLPQFFSSVYREFFAKWPPTPNEQELNAAGGDAAVATAVAQEREQQV